ncbi:unnamed protein product, partial [Rotaria sp. Silwood1]
MPANQTTPGPATIGPQTSMRLNVTTARPPGNGSFTSIPADQTTPRPATIGPQTSMRLNVTTARPP